MSPPFSSASPSRPDGHPAWVQPSGAILGLAASQPGIAFTLLLAYSLGLGLPFIVTGLFASRVAPAISKYSRVLQYINIAFGIVLIVLGILIFTQTLGLIADLPLLNNFLQGSL